MRLLARRWQEPLGAGLAGAELPLPVRELQQDVSFSSVWLLAPDTVINAAGPWLPVAHIRGEHITFSSGLCLNAFSQRIWEAFQKQPGFLQAEHHRVPRGPIKAAVSSAALPCRRGWDPKTWPVPGGAGGARPAPSHPCRQGCGGSAQGPGFLKNGKWGWGWWGGSCSGGCACPGTRPC